MHSWSPPQTGSAETAQLSTWSTKNCTSAQPRATQLATQVTLNSGGNEPRSMHSNAQVTISMQPSVVQVPQSWGQMAQVSKSSHSPLGHTEHTPQSCAQEAQVSTPLH